MPMTHQDLLSKYRRRLLVLLRQLSDNPQLEYHDNLLVFEELGSLDKFGRIVSDLRYNCGLHEFFEEEMKRARMTNGQSLSELTFGELLNLTMAARAVRDRKTDR